MKLNINKNFFILAASISSLAACSMFNSSSTNTPRRITQNISELGSGTIVPAVAIIPMDIPNPNQRKIVNTAAFRVAENVRSSPAGILLIPQNALVTGIYSNDGAACQIAWQSIYSDYQALEKNQPTISIAYFTKNTACNPKLGVRPGQMFNIIFK